MEVVEGSAQPRKRVLGIALRVVLTAATFAFLFTRIPLREFQASLQRIPAAGILGCLVAFLAALCCNILRWRSLLQAYGARELPRLPALTRWYIVSMFYNLLPGAVGGDLLRGYATRHYFDDSAVSRSMGVVFVERVLGLAGLLILAALASSFGPLRDRQVLIYSALGLCAAASAVAALAVGRRLERWLPARIANIARTLPALARPGGFASALSLAVVTHVLLALAGHAVIGALDANVRLGDSMVFFPVGTLAAYFPLSVAGAGARDTALVFLFARRGVSESDALACSLTLLLIQLLVSGIGGFLHAPRTSSDSDAKAFS
ncbi:MAG TPA: lysylphosphatidylglycerol synthase transmembrane domain-containing protein [Polyangiales bacterium]|nr:lysylphosphatidylglycerol synthase transmembrane domain-containing protein [Polyangiales bacterium]